MKYMGSKRAMLQNGLGELLSHEATGARRFVDLFAGSGAVAIHVACRFPIPVLAFDLQHYSTVLTGAVINRKYNLDWQSLWDAWKCRAQAEFNTRKVPKTPRLTQAVVADFRSWCDAQTELPVTKAYGGHYFSPQQAVWIDELRSNLPQREPAKTVALAALIRAASQCVASPGHTAQPFQPTRTAKFFLAEAWGKEIVAKTGRAFEAVAGQFARHRGQAKVDDANQAVAQLREGDLAFIDPPYSGVHYSRFYHVLETIARGACGSVSGSGRYPPAVERPRSKYSVFSESRQEISRLIEQVAARGATAIVTFPDKKCSNGISSYLLEKLGREHFRLVDRRSIRGRFSTLGGNGKHRDARQPSAELVLILRP